jgi:hypothetical protein
MLDGRIDTHGTVSELREQGLLPKIIASEEDEGAPVEEIPSEDVKTEGMEAGDEKKGMVVPERKKARELHKKEERSAGE